MKTRWLLLLALPATSCVTVQPWERARLADVVMQPELVPEAAALEAHFTATVEGSAGANGVAGGGCGCN